MHSCRLYDNLSRPGRFCYCGARWSRGKPKAQTRWHDTSAQAQIAMAYCSTRKRQDAGCPYMRASASSCPIHLASAPAFHDDCHHASRVMFKLSETRSTGDVMLGCCTISEGLRYHSCRAFHRYVYTGRSIVLHMIFIAAVCAAEGCGFARYCITRISCLWREVVTGACVSTVCMILRRLFSSFALL